MEAQPPRSRERRSPLSWAPWIAILLLGCGGGWTDSARADDGTIRIRLSYKVILNPVDGTRPPDVDDAAILAAVDGANEWMARYGRGYRFEVVEIVDVGGACSGPCTTANPSYWYDLVLGWPSYPDFQDAARNLPAYAFHPNALNIYVNAGHPGGECALARDGHDVVIFGGAAAAERFVLTHEAGHYLDLLHTHHTQPTCGQACSGCAGGDDEIPDTLLDRDCWTWMDVADANYGSGWTASPTQVAAVDDTYHNVMSYHEPDTRNQTQDRMTELQLDHITDIANTLRIDVVSGQTRFVAPSGSPSGSGSSTLPFDLPSTAVGAADPGGGDIILLRPGVYLESLTVSKPVTLRAPRSGDARIGG